MAVYRCNSAVYRIALGDIDGARASGCAALNFSHRSNASLPPSLSLVFCHEFILPLLQMSVDELTESWFQIGLRTTMMQEGVQPFAPLKPLPCVSTHLAGESDIAAYVPIGWWSCGYHNL